MLLGQRGAAGCRCCRFLLCAMRKSQKIHRRSPASSPGFLVFVRSMVFRFLFHATVRLFGHHGCQRRHMDTRSTDLLLQHIRLHKVTIFCFGGILGARIGSLILPPCFQYPKNMIRVHFRNKPFIGSFRHSEIWPWQFELVSIGKDQEQAI